MDPLVFFVFLRERNLGFKGNMSTITASIKTLGYLEGIIKCDVELLGSVGRNVKLCEIKVVKSNHAERE